MSALFRYIVRPSMPDPQCFRDLIDESVNALFALLVEKVHSWAQYWRK